MSRTTTLLSLRDRIRRRCDARSIRVTDAELNEDINLAVQEVDDIIISGDPYWRVESVDLKVTINAQTVALPTASYKQLFLQVLRKDGGWSQPLDTFDLRDQDDLRQNWQHREDIRWRLVGPSIMFDRLPGWTQAAGLRLWHIPVIADMGNDADTYDGIHGWDEYVVRKVCSWQLDTEAKDVTVSFAFLGKLEASIRKRAELRNLGTARKIWDAGGGRFQGGRRGYNRYGRRNLGLP